MMNALQRLQSGQQHQQKLAVGLMLVSVSALSCWTLFNFFSSSYASSLLSHRCGPNGGGAFDDYDNLAHHSTIHDLDIVHSASQKQQQRQAYQELLANFSDLQSQYNTLLEQSSKQIPEKPTKRPTRPPMVPQDVWYKSARTWATAASQRAWGEFDCVGPEVDPAISPRHNATHYLWQALGRNKCGCLHLCEFPKFTKSSCTGPPPSHQPKCSASAKKPLWIVFVGDSTFRYFFTTLKSILNAVDIAPKPKIFEQQRSFDDEGRYEGAFGLDEDFDAIFEQRLVFSHRALWWV